MHPLNQLSAEELGKLFPIIMAEPDANWPAIFETEKNRLLEKLPQELVLRIEHIGSTAVPGLAAKPTIDILMEINEIPAHLEKLTAALKAAGYDCIPRPGLPAPQLMGVKGYTAAGFEGQAVHLHVRYAGDWDEIVFRDYLRAHPEALAAYAALKKELAVKYRNNREDYTESKTAFIREIVSRAKAASGK